MSYASLEDLIARAGETEILQVADRDCDGTPDPDVIASALAAADNKINGYVGARYDLPLPTVPDLVKTWAVSIARYFLFSNGAPEHVRLDYDDAISDLQDVVAKKIALPVAAPDAKPVSQTGLIMAEHPPQVFTPQKLAGWR